MGTSTKPKPTKPASAKPRPVRKTKPETALHVEVFEIWYTEKRQVSGVAKICEKLRVNPATVYRWMAVYDWHARADKRDEEARKKADISAIDRTAKTLKDHMQAGELLRQRGVERLVAKPISDEKTAVSAIKLGVELERQALGLPNDVGQQQLEVNVAGQVDINEAALLAAIERLLDDEDALRKANAAPEEGKAIEGTG